MKAIETVLKRWSTPRLNIGSALAAHGKRLRGANRNRDGHFETAILVAHDTGLPVASHGFHDENGERSAIAALFEEVSFAGRVITVDALHTVRDSARSIVESHNAVAHSAQTLAERSLQLASIGPPYRLPLA